MPINTTPIAFDDGTMAYVPNEKVQAALSDGGKLIQSMIFDDGSKAWVPLDKVKAAMADGGQVIGAPPRLSLLPNSEIKESTLGRFWGGPTGNSENSLLPSPKGQMAEQTKPSPAVGALTLLGVGALGASQIPGVSRVATAAVKAAPYIAASEGINLARQHLPLGKHIPPGAELIPFFFGGTRGRAAKAEAAEAEASGAPVYRDATPLNRPYAGEAAPTVSSELSLLPAKPAATTVSRAQVEQQLRDSLGGAPPLKPNLTLRQQIPGAAAKSTTAIPESFVPVENSVVKGFKYDAAKAEMEVRSADGGHYIYGDVSPTEAETFANSESQSRAWNKLKQSHTFVGKYVGGKRIAVKPKLSLLNTQE